MDLYLEVVVRVALGAVSAAMLAGTVRHYWQEEASNCSSKKLGRSSEPSESRQTGTLCSINQSTNTVIFHSQALKRIRSHPAMA